MGGLKDAMLGDTPMIEAPPRQRRLYPADIPVAVCDLFERLAIEVYRSGWRHFSSDALLHRIRWFHQVEMNNKSFKVNDHWSAPLARWFLEKHPNMAGFFELRELRSRHD